MVLQPQRCFPYLSSASLPSLSFFNVLVCKKRCIPSHVRPHEALLTDNNGTTHPMCHVLSVSLCLTHIWSEDDFVLVEPCGLESAVLTGPTLSDSCLPVSCLSFYPSGCDPRIDPAVPLCLRSTLRCPSTPT